MTTTKTATPDRPAKSKGGAPKGNRNAASDKHGVRGWLNLGSTPDGASYVRKIVFGLRRQVEAAVVDQHGELNIYRAALVQSLCRHEGRALLLTRWLRLEKDLTLAERLAVLKEIGAASDSRDKCLERLGLNVDRQADPMASLRQRIALAASESTGEHLDDSTDQQAAARNTERSTALPESRHPIVGSEIVQ